MPDTPRWTEYMPIDELVPADRNAKDHDEPGLASSMDRFGYLQSIVLDERTGKIVGGHGRRDMLRAKHEQGESPPDGIVVIDGAWHAPVERGWASHSDAEAEAAGIALNRIGEGLWRRDELAVILDDLAAVAPGLEGIGYTITDLEDLRALGSPPDDLDALSRQYGDPDPQQMWPVLRFKVSPALRDRYLRVVEGVEGGDDVLFEYLIGLAER